MPDKSDKKDIKELLIPDFPKIKILGEVWEYRARSSKLVDFAQEFNALEVDKENPEETIKRINELFHQFITLVFLKGEELYQRLDEKFQGDVFLWMQTISAISESVLDDNVKLNLSDLQRFKREN